jgi:hypothetical protein
MQLKYKKIVLEFKDKTISVPPKTNLNKKLINLQNKEKPL